MPPHNINLIPTGVPSQTEQQERQGKQSNRGAKSNITTGVPSQTVQQGHQGKQSNKSAKNKKPNRGAK